MQPALQAVALDRDRIWFLDTLVHVRVSAEDSADGVSVLEHLVLQGSSPPLHVHHDEDEVFHVIEGEIRIKLGQHVHRVRAGQTLMAPRGIPHTFCVDSWTARVLTVTCNGSFERFVRTIGRPAESETLPVLDGPPTPEQMQTLGEVGRSCQITFVGPPLS
jgi:quercetin dioxygenase-like cupin family protein